MGNHKACLHKINQEDDQESSTSDRYQVYMTDVLASFA